MSVSTLWNLKEITPENEFLCFPRWWHKKILKIEIKFFKFKQKRIFLSFLNVIEKAQLDLKKINLKTRLD